MPVALAPIPATALASSAARRPMTKTLAPSAAKHLAVARPMPVEPPVMTAILPSSMPGMAVTFAVSKGLIVAAGCAHRRPRRSGRRSASAGCQPRNPSSSAFTRSFSVVHMPCGAPSYTLSAAFLMSFDDSIADAAIGTIRSSLPAWESSRVMSSGQAAHCRRRSASVSADRPRVPPCGQHSSSPHMPWPNPRPAHPASCDASPPRRTASSALGLIGLEAAQLLDGGDIEERIVTSPNPEWCPTSLHPRRPRHG